MDRSDYPTRKTRLGEVADNIEIRSMSPGERMNMVWQLTLQAWAFKEGLQGEPRLRGDVGRVIRGGRRVGRRELLRNKRATGRPRDLADVAELEQGEG